MGSWPLPSEKTSLGWLSLSPVNHSDTDISSLSLPSFKDSCDYTGPTWIMQDILILRSTLNFIYNLTVPLPCDITYSKVPCLEGIILPITIGI